jgi:2-amino-4-hydroxy-6-hydroxymethyldihydropteridine diphosphokinase
MGKNRLTGVIKFLQSSLFFWKKKKQITYLCVFAREITEISDLMLGGNVGDRMDYLRQSIDLLRREVGRVMAMSAVYESEPWGFDDPCWFLNQVVAVETDHDPFTLLENIQRIEQVLGRVRTQNTYQARTVDIDILLYGNLVMNMPELVIPHPRMVERMFVLQPMTELAPDLKHPVLHFTMSYLRDHCTDTKQVRLKDNAM